MQRICVFAGSQPGNRPEYARTARTLGRELAERGLALVYAGAGVGLMAVTAESARSAGGEVIGVALHADQPCGGGRGPTTSWFRAASVEERTALMADLADGFIVSDRIPRLLTAQGAAELLDSLVAAAFDSHLLSLICKEVAR